MNKILLFIFISTLPMLVKAQQLPMDKVYQDGSRLLESQCIYIRNGFTDKNPIGVSIMALSDSCNNTDYFFHLRISSMKSYTIPQNSIMLFKVANNDVIEVKQGWESYKTEDTIGTYIPYTGRIHISEGIYPIGVFDLGSMASMGVVKIRIETQYENIDINYSQKKAKEFGEAIFQCMGEVFGALKIKKDIRDGF